ncbi:conserved hypothetical protein [Altererythrobacter sp. B11]|uniref:hypothetical protein n=1 Tax=Altererythrobacter sp. B11 TaxID=2060312 RepID=UPI000DC7011A|nr:hypothetical protein [Altererythrobacter sp. B11]BBC74310.1 conserved hypothetical protein [Altererythrobacter sp. B11]
MSHTRTAVALAALSLSIAACQQDADPAPAPAGVEGAAQPAPVPSPSPSPGPIAGATPAAVASLTPEAEKGEKGARNVLLAWARALETGDYATAYAQYGDNGARSGMSAQEFADKWRRFKTITISVPEGQMEGAAGSSYYSVPATVVGKQQDGHPYRLEGEVVLRRVNDVPGATPEQLRWHLESSDLQPVN